MALKKSTFLSSGHKVSQKYSSEYEDCHNKNPLKRSSPLVLMMRFGSSIPSVYRFLLTNSSSTSSAVILPSSTSLMIFLIVSIISSLPSYPIAKLKNLLLYHGQPIF